MSFRSHEVRPQSHVSFVTVIYGTDHAGFTSTGKGIEKPLSPKKPIIQSEVEETNGTTDSQ